MKTMAVFGKQEFTLGFELTGIKKVINPTNLKEQTKELMKDRNVGIVIIDQETMNSFDDDLKEEVVASIDPVFVVVSASSSQEELRKMVRQSIGVDLLKGE